MGVVYGIVWSVAGLAMAVLGLAVTPAEEAPSGALMLGLGLVGGFGGGLLIELLARPTVPGFTAGLMGSLIGSSILLVIGSVLAQPAREEA